MIVYVAVGRKASWPHSPRVDRVPRADDQVVHLGTAPSLADYCALAALVAVSDVYYARRLLPRLGPSRTLVLVLPVVVTAGLLLAIDPKHRYIIWWLPIGAPVITILVGTIGPPILLVRRRHQLVAVWPGPGQRALASLVVSVMVASALTAVAGTVVLAIATQDLRLALAGSLLAALLLRMAWELIAKRRFPPSPDQRPDPPSPSS